MTDIDEDRQTTSGDADTKDERRPASRRRAVSEAMMQALEDDMEVREGVYRRLADC